MSDQSKEKTKYIESIPKGIYEWDGSMFHFNDTGKLCAVYRAGIDGQIWMGRLPKDWIIVQVTWR